MHWFRSTNARIDCLRRLQEVFKNNLGKLTIEEVQQYFILLWIQHLFFFSYLLALLFSGPVMLWFVVYLWKQSCWHMANALSPYQLYWLGSFPTFASVGRKFYGFTLSLFSALTNLYNYMYFPNIKPNLLH